MDFAQQRKFHAGQLRTYLQRVNKIASDLEALTVKNDLEEDRGIRLRDLEDLKLRLEQRLSRLEQSRVNIAVIGLEKQGKTSVVNAWVGYEVLPTDIERCTWASTTIRNDPEVRSAEIHFYTRDEASRLTESLINRLPDALRQKVQFPVTKQVRSDSELEPEWKRADRIVVQELESLSEAWNEFETELGRTPKIIKGERPEEILEGLRPYVARVARDGKPQYKAYAVKEALVSLPLTEESVDFQISDLPGLNAPGNRAEEITWKALENSADIIVWVKNAADNPSLDRDEENVWTKAHRSDESIQLTDRLFILLNQADYDKIEHGRDCHIQAKENFRKRLVPEKRIFFCSARAELKELGLGSSFSMTTEEIDRAKNKICGYSHRSNPTTGFGEFREAIVGFVKADLPRIESEAFENLIESGKNVLQRVQRFVERLTDAFHARASASDEEIRAFEKLWHPTAADAAGKGLGRAILRALQSAERRLRGGEAGGKALADQLTKAINQVRDQVLEEITPKLFQDEIPEIGAGPDLVVPELEGQVRSRFRRRLKEHIPRITSDVYPMTHAALEELWQVALGTTDAESAEAKLAMITGLPRELTGQSGFLKNMKMTDLNEESIRIGYTAMLQTATYAPLNLLLISDESSTGRKASQLREKISRFESHRAEGLSEKEGSFLEQLSEEVNRSGKPSKTLDRIVDQVKSAASTDTIRDSLSKLVKDRPEVIAKFLALRLVPPQMRLASMGVQMAASVLGVRAKESLAASVERPMTQERDLVDVVLEDLKQRTTEVFDAIKAVLLDEDFGLIAFHLSIVEGMRLALDREVRDGRLKELAFKHRRTVWPEEQAFRLTEFYQKQNQYIDSIRQHLT